MTLANRVCFNPEAFIGRSGSKCHSSIFADIMQKRIIWAVRLNKTIKF